MRRRQILGALIGVLIGVALISHVVVVVRTWAVTDQIRETQKQTASATFLIEDCTKPTGECYRRARRSSATTVHDLNRVSVYAAACASGPARRTAPQIQACVKRLILADQE